MGRDADGSADRGVLRLALLSGVLAVAGAVAVYTAGVEPLEPLQTLPMWAAVVILVVLFVAAEVVKFHVEVYRQAMSVALSDLPLVLGLFLLPPLWIVVARLVAGTIVFVARRTALPKSVFNLCLYTFEVGVACVLLHALLPEAASSAAQWLVSFAVVFGVDLVGAIAVIAAIALIQAPLGLAESARMTAAVLVSGALSTTLALMALAVMEISPWGLLLLLVFTVCLSLAYRAYSQLLARHDDLGQLFAASRRMGAARTAEELEDELIALARVVARADHARLVRVQHQDGDPVLGTVTARALTRNSRDPAERVWLDRNGSDDAMLVPIRSDGYPIATLVVTDRQGSTSSFTPDDLRRVQMLAGHAEVLWANGHLVEQLRHDAYHDDLTGLANRSGFMAELSRRLDEVGDETAGLLPEPGTPDAAGAPCEAALLLFDLDRFKEVNDTLGHHVGDTLLVMVAERFRALAPSDASIARLGGDEFAILLPHTVSREEVYRTAERVRDGIGTALNLSGTILEVGASVGIAAVPADGREPATLLRRADVAMYAAKRSGSVSWYRSEDDTNSIDRLKMLAELRKAIEDGVLAVAYQPQFDLVTGQVVGFEALARWAQPDRGPVPPEEFVAMAEQAGLAGMLATAVLRQALAQCRAWTDVLPDAGVAVNLSPRLMADPDLPDLVEEMLAAAGVPEHLLTLEITEHSLMGGTEAAVAGLHRMRSRGVRISVDDFGTGYSSLAYLRNLPVDEVKIDKMFVIPMADDRGSEAIVRSVVDLSHQLGLTVVAEGVEDEETRRLVLEAGCDLAQGFGLGRPLAADDVPAWLAALPSQADRLPRDPHQLAATPGWLPGDSQDPLSDS